MCSNNADDDARDVVTLSREAVLGWLELGCWTMVVLAPFLYWVNGPAVSTDQLVVRSGLVGFALGGGLALRLAARLRGSRSSARHSAGQVQATQTGERESRS